MGKPLFYTILLISVVITQAKDEDLPLCPTNFQYFPQTLPMHCRMPTGGDFPGYPGMQGFPTMNPAGADKNPMPVPNPQGMPGPLPMPGGMPGPMIPMPMPMPGPAPSHKVPVIVMPFYSPDPSFKKPERPKKPGPNWINPKIPHETESSDTDTSSDTSDTESDTSSENGWWKGKKHGWRKNGRRSNKKRRHHSKRRHGKKKNTLLTPVLQYVTNDGYVIYEKTISKDEAKDWLRVSKDEKRPEDQNEGKYNEDQNASVHEVKPEAVEDINMNREGEDKYELDNREDEREKEELTTVKAHVRRHHRKAASPINKLLPKRTF